MVTLKVSDLNICEELSETYAAVVIGGYSVGEWWNDVKEGADTVGDIVQEVAETVTDRVDVGLNGITITTVSGQDIVDAVDRGLLGL